MGGRWWRPPSRLRELLFWCIWIDSRIPRLNQPESWSNISTLSQSMVWWEVVECSATAEFGLLCSVSRVPSDLAVSPTYDAGQSAHLTWYTTPHLLSFSVLSFGDTNNALSVLYGFMWTCMPRFLSTRLRCSETPATYGIVTWPFCCVVCALRSVDLLRVAFHTQGSYPHIDSADV